MLRSILVLSVCQVVLSQSDENVEINPKTKFPVNQEKGEYWDEKAANWRGNDKDLKREIFAKLENKKEEIGEFKKDLNMRAKIIKENYKVPEVKPHFTLDEDTLDYKFIR